MKVLLNGGGCGEKTKEIYSFIDKIIDNTKPILCVPLARDKDESGYENSKKWLEQELRGLHYAGIVMADSDDYISRVNLFDFGLVYISGGNTYKLMKELKQKGAFNKIKDYINGGGVVYGSSAGAAICGFSLRSVEYADTNDVGLQDIAGYNLLHGMSIAAHYTNKNEKKTKIATEYLTEMSKTEPVIALPEEDTIYIDGDSIVVLGQRDYYIFKNGFRVACKPGITMTTEDFLNQ